MGMGMGEAMARGGVRRENGKVEERSGVSMGEAGYFFSVFIGCGIVSAGVVGVAVGAAVVRVVFALLTAALVVFAFVLLVVAIG